MFKFFIQLAFHFWPELYKKRFFKSLKSLNTDTYKCEPELGYLNKILHPNATFIDIGTNKGIYLYQAEQIITTGRIIGFEPNSDMVKLASHLFPKAQIVPLAISSKTGTATLFIPKIATGLQDTRGSLEALGDNVEKVEIQTITLDSWVQNNHLTTIDVVKIDVEGHEYDAILGCQHILQHFKPIFIIEIELRHAHYPIEAIFNFIQKFNYNVYYLDRKSKQLTPFDYTKMQLFQEDAFLNNFNLYINNFIFIPNQN